MTQPIVRSAVLLLLSTPLLAVQQTAYPPTTAAQAPTRDTSYIDPGGTAHVTRVVPLPQTISPQGRAMLGRAIPDQEAPESLAERRARTDAFTAKARIAWSKLCPDTITEEKIAGVPVRVIRPANLAPDSHDKVLLNLHGGGFNSDSGSYTETIPIAYYTRIKVVAVLYRLAPEHPFPAAVDDAIAVYKELLRTYNPNHIVVYGTSAGAILTGEVAVRIKQLGLPMPAALGIFSGMGDFAHNGDSMSLFGLRGLSGHLDSPTNGVHDSMYVGTTDPRDPVLSPVYADLHGLPPTLFISSTRDMLLSGTANLDRAFLNAGVDAHLEIFDAFPHAFWYGPELPEAIEANHTMASFFLKHLAR